MTLTEELWHKDGWKEIYQFEVALKQQAPKMQAFQASLTEDVQFFIVDLFSGTRLTDYAQNVKTSLGENSHRAGPILHIPGYPGLCQFKFIGGRKLGGVSKCQRSMPNASSQLSSQLGYYLLRASLDKEDILISKQDFRNVTNETHRSAQKKQLRSCPRTSATAFNKCP